MRAPTRIYVFLAIGLVAASQSGNIIRIGDAHPVAIAAWRLLLASLLFLPLAGTSLRSLATLTRREILLLVLTSTLLVGHFFAWIAAVQMTTVANAAIFLALTPVFAAIGAYFAFGERVGPRLVLAIVIGLAGVGIIGFGDLGFRREQAWGDASALLCAILFAAYLVAGRRLNPRLPTMAFVAAMYGIAAVISFAFLFALRLPVVDYDGRTWICFLLMALVPTALGHTGFNAALRHLPAGWVSATTLVEPAMAGAVAYVAWDEPITAWVGVGYGLVIVSVLVMARASLPRGR